ncbi:unnamed protein product [Prunus armeniaca]
MNHLTPLFQSQPIPASRSPETATKQSGLDSFLRNFTELVRTPPATKSDEIGVFSRDVEIFRRSVITLSNHALPARGNCSSEALCPNVILLLSQARRNSRISIRITFEPRTDLA